MKLCDFGLCRSVAESAGPSPVLTDYVATRWYRAPEILLGSNHYTKGIDIWSLGCILAEMLANRPLFQGNSTMNQLEKIIQVTGKPSGDDIDSIKSPFSLTMLESIPPIRQTSMSELFPGQKAEALEVSRGARKVASETSAERVVSHIDIDKVLLSLRSS